MSPLLLMAILTTIALTSLRYAVDSRWAGPGEPPPPLQRRHTLTGDVAALARLLRRSVPTARG
ncbi:hypothetical protein [Pseudonocardia sp.]|uniref:hypothetical protein n=1 Tax=Pseudonocardia sp. TaxID=60912 RepID=UPI003D116F04